MVLKIDLIKLCATPQTFYTLTIQSFLNLSTERKPQLVSLEIQLNVSID